MPGANPRRTTPWAFAGPLALLSNCRWWRAWSTHSASTCAHRISGAWTSGTMASAKCRWIIRCHLKRLIVSCALTASIAVCACRMKTCISPRLTHGRSSKAGKACVVLSCRAARAISSTGRLTIHCRARGNGRINRRPPRNIANLVRAWWICIP